MSCLGPGRNPSATIGLDNADSDTNGLGVILSQNLYELGRIVERARAWRREGDVAPLMDMREFCLEEARRCEEIVRRSMETPLLSV
jgi:hypothetical protein